MPLFPFITFENCAEVVCQGELAGQAAYLTSMVQKASPFAGTDLADIGDIYASWLSINLLPFLNSLLTFNSVKVTDLTTQFSPVAISTTTLPASGTVSTSPVPNNVAAVVSFATANRGRSFRGRNYIPGAPAAQLATATSFGSTFIADLVTEYNALIAALSGAGFTFVIGSRFVNGVRRTTGVPTRVTAVIGRTAVGTQRRRVIGHGI